jgi:hypothetical protein
MTRQSPVLDRTIQKLIEELAAHREPPIYELTPEERTFGPTIEVR